MRSLRYAKLWWALGLLLVAIVLTLSLLPTVDVPVQGFNDKVNHTLAFAAMAGWFGGTALYYPPPALADRLAAIDAVTADDLIATARQVFTPAGLALAAVGALSKARVGELREVITGWQ